MRISRETRRILCVLFCLCMALSCITVTAFAADGDACATDGCAGTYTNGFCSVESSHYEPAVLNSQGVYEISNGGQLCWFASFVDKNTQLAGEDVSSTSANAVLTGDITINQNVLVDGDLNPDEDIVDEFRAWNAIGSNKNKYTGTFDGANHTVSGLYYDKTSTLGTYVGLFASLGEGAIVKNVNLADSFIQAKSNAGGIAGSSEGGTIENCSNAAVIITEGSDVGGIVGTNDGTVIRCTNAGTVTGENENVGGIAGYNFATIEHCANCAKVSGASNSNESYIGGIAGYNYNGTIKDCYNIGKITNKGKYSGGLVGAAYAGTIDNCYSIGMPTGKANVGSILGGHYKTPVITNCYYLSDSETDSYGGTIAKTAEQFASGEICFLLNGSTSTPAEGNTLVWYQTLGNDASPAFQGGTVYTCYASCAEDAEIAYTNDINAVGSRPHPATENSHTCGLCGEPLSECSDADGDDNHSCDICGKENITECSDSNTDTDHNCDECGAKINECADENKDHKCDICEKVLSECADENKDHKCDVCEKVLSQCADSDGDYECDTCGADMGTPPDPECPKDETCILAKYSDLVLTEWYHDAIHYCVEEYLMTGTSDTTFEPIDTLSRAMLVQILYNVEGRPAAETDKSFTDVSEDDWYYDAVMWAAEEGIVLGNPDGTYAPEDDVTREQMVTILWRYAGEPKASAEEIPFTDAADIDDWARAAVLWAFENEVVQGVGENRFNPDGNSERAEAAQLMMNYFTK